MKKAKPEAHGIEEDTPILPWAVAESVIGEVGYFLSTRGKSELASALVKDEDRLVSHLTAFAQSVYQNNEDVRRKIRRSGNRGRDYLYTFMRHWLSAELAKTHPATFRLLPNDFKLGHELPRETSNAKIQA